MLENIRRLLFCVVCACVYTKKKGTMLLLRSRYIRGAGDVLAKASTVVTRYSCVRKQGFVDPQQGLPHMSEERTILDHSVQRYRVFKQLALAYALCFVGRWMTERFVVFYFLFFFTILFFLCWCWNYAERRKRF